MSNFLIFSSLSPKELEFYEIRLKIALKKAKLTSKGCLLASTCSKKAYPKMSICSKDLGSKKLVTLSSFIMYLNDRLSNNKSNYDISHLCGHKNCIFFDHLSFEPHSINISRVQCHRLKGSNRKCHGHSENGEDFAACIL